MSEKQLPPIWNLLEGIISPDPRSLSEWTGEPMTCFNSPITGRIAADARRPGVVFSDSSGQETFSLTHFGIQSSRDGYVLSRDHAEKLLRCAQHLNRDPARVEQLQSALELLDHAAPPFLVTCEMEIHHQGLRVHILGKKDAVEVSFSAGDDQTANTLVIDAHGSANLSRVNQRDQLSLLASAIAEKLQKLAARNDTERLVIFLQRLEAIVMSYF